ncbi:MAG: hypothetical protein LBG58_04765 [Planctomycetaceae bacterium]|jgi:hypothetical protein|nr:hypothetical protein [Planctomycetaceae bacterium]
MFRRNIALPIGNSESDSIGQFVFLTGLETDCRRENRDKSAIADAMFRRNIAYLLIICLVMNN